MLNAVVGAVVVLQQIPRALTVAPPSAVTLPPLVAVVDVMAETTVVAAIVGATQAFTVNVFCTLEAAL